MDTVKINSTSRDAFAAALEVAVAAQSPEGVIEAFASQGAQVLKAMASAAKQSRDRHNGGSSPHGVPAEDMLTLVAHALQQDPQVLQAQVDEFRRDDTRDESGETKSLRDYMDTSAGLTAFTKDLAKRLLTRQNHLESKEQIEDLEQIVTTGSKDDMWESWLGYANAVSTGTAADVFTWESLRIYIIYIMCQLDKEEESKDESPGDESHTHAKLQARGDDEDAYFHTGY